MDPHTLRFGFACVSVDTRIRAITVGRIMRSGGRVFRRSVIIIDVISNHLHSQAARRNRKVRACRGHFIEVGRDRSGERIGARVRGEVIEGARAARKARSARDRSGSVRKGGVRARSRLRNG